MSLDFERLERAFPEWLAGVSNPEVRLLKQGLRADTHAFDFDREGEPRQYTLLKRWKDESEWAQNELYSYQLFTAQSLSLAPRLLAVNQDARLVALERLADCSDLLQMIARGSGLDLALARLGGLMGQLAAGTTLGHGLSRQADRRDTRNAEADALGTQLGGILALGAAWGIAADDRLERCARALVESYRTPYRIAWTQGDPAPSNVLFAEGRAVLIDFEYGGFRHALHDLAQWQIRCPLPQDWYRSLEDSVESAMLEDGTYPDAAKFAEDVAMMQAYASIHMLGFLPARAGFAADRSWVGDWTLRDALLCTTARGADAAAATPLLEPLSDWLRTLNAALHRAWPERGSGEPDWTKQARAISSGS
jgi:hypothetical protein